jgi:hypothetical protein
MGVVVHDCNPNYVDDVGRRIDVWSQLQVRT